MDTNSRLKPKKTIETFFSKNIEKIEKDTQSSNFPNTAKALFQNIRKLEQISKGSYSINDNFYSSKILQRVAIELYLVGHYIYVRTSKDKSDEVGEDYYKYYYCQEGFKRENYNAMTQDSITNVKGERGLARLIQNHPEFSFMKDADYIEINRKANLFDIKKIISALNNEYNNSDFSDLHNFMTKLTEIYNETSSYIHGGPIAESEFLELNMSEKKSEIKNVQDWCSSLTRHAKTNYLTFLGSTDYQEYLMPVKNILEK
ncbi:hypothetical protein [Acidiluteibacter ferrifornacis]|uniref:Uncharacterized protein n=1 Tax=Acidiluteibacter ferrifornacis TaxID=2692424 RepID=A0A6N9NFU6_9FLAO|nr:hypothetical protein [Acidiluteibacter ferrifornacis]NBG65506.1 hypothetical protein [Acidiluteibacter ferrifornacis]